MIIKLQAKALVITGPCVARIVPKIKNFGNCFCLFVGFTSMSSRSTDIEILFEIKRFDGKGFDLSKNGMKYILFLKDCDGAGVAVK